MNDEIKIEFEGGFLYLKPSYYMSTVTKRKYLTGRLFEKNQNIDLNFEVDFDALISIKKQIELLLLKDSVVQYLNMK